MGNQKVYLQWNNDSLIWNLNDYVWSEVFIIIQVGTAVGGGGGLVLPKNNPWDEVKKVLKEKEFPEEKIESFLQVVAKVNGLVTKQTKKQESIEKLVQIKHIRKTFEQFGQKVNVEVKNVKNT
jgi:hypothetical protein